MDHQIVPKNGYLAVVSAVIADQLLALPSGFDDKATVGHQRGSVCEHLVGQLVQFAENLRRQCVRRRLRFLLQIGLIKPALQKLELLERLVTGPVHPFLGHVSFGSGFQVAEMPEQNESHEVGPFEVCFPKVVQQPKQKQEQLCRGLYFCMGVS